MKKNEKKLQLTRLTVAKLASVSGGTHPVADQDPRTTEDIKGTKGIIG
jgi:hypothetical protein